VHRESQIGEYRITTDPSAIDVEVVHGYLTRCYWSPGIPREIVERAVANSLCFGVFHGSAQVGFARLITDRATFAYLADVFILEAYQGKGLGRWLLEVIMGHPEVQGLRRWMLATRDAHGLYRQYGFVPVAAPERIMEILVPDMYLRRPPDGEGV
jgi:GNAT superfamily N-acetyltransferase